MINKVIKAIKKEGSSMIVQDDFVSGGIFAYRTNKKVGTPYIVPNEALIEDIGFEYYKTNEASANNWWLGLKEIARFNREEFVKIIQAATAVANIKDTYYYPDYINYIRFDICAGEATVTATRTARLFSRKIACQAKDKFTRCFLAKTLKKALPLFLDGEDIVVRENGVFECNNILVFVENLAVATEKDILEDTIVYPKFHAVMKGIESCDITVTCNRKELIKCVTTFKKAKQNIVLCVKNNLLNLFGMYFYKKKANALPLINTIPCTTVGEIIYGIDESFLLDALKATNDENVTLYFSSKNYNVFIDNYSCIAGINIDEVE